jgi:hypothetical protein
LATLTSNSISARELRQNNPFAGLLDDATRHQVISATGSGTREEVSARLCLDPHDLVLSKLVANSEKDIEFADAVIAARLVELGRLIELVAALPTPEGVRRRVRTTLRRVAR